MVGGKEDEGLRWRRKEVFVANGSGWSGTTSLAVVVVHDGLGRAIERPMWTRSTIVGVNGLDA